MQWFDPGSEKNNRFKIDNQGIIRLPPLVRNESSVLFSKNSCRSIIPQLNMTTVGLETNIIVSTRNDSQTIFNIAESHTLNNSINSDISHIPKMTSNIEISSKLSKKSDQVTSGSQNNKKLFAFISHSQETFLSNEPCIDNASLARRKRRRTSKHELSILQQEFGFNPTPSKARRIYLAQQCNMTEKAVQIWFQNKRQSVKKKSSDYTHSNLTMLSPSTTNTSPTRCIQNLISSQETPLLISTVNSISKTNVGQALTFRLRRDKELTPILTSANNRVNKLINGKLVKSSNFNTANKFNFKRNKPSVLTELNVNIMKT